ncbi:MFS transporter [Streptomyces malaysiensis]|uniref:hypothetical protein n=1 Tax=Streptomyces malaysiensis TaxID=92644 RepID=UPI003220113A|nr:hypothetical protein [Streptomyces malaysiensis]
MRSFLAPLPVFLVRTLDTPAGLVGVLIATERFGSLIGAALAPKLADRVGSARALLVTTAFGAVVTLLLPLAQGGWRLLLFALGNTGFGASVVVLSIPTRTRRQTVTPPSWGAVPFGPLTAGVAAGLLGNRGSPWQLCALAFLAPPAVWTRGIRRMRDLT